MNKTLGFFLGSATVFAMLVFVLGQPVPLAPPAQRQADFATDESARQAESQAPAPKVEQASARATATSDVIQEAAPQAVESIAGNAAAMTAPLPDVAPANETQPEFDELAMTAELVRQSSSMAEPLPDQLQAAQPVPAMESLGSFEQDVEWYPLWDPFHSQYSANAFARRLESVTGLDYEVFRTDDRGYRVAVAYQSEEQRLVNVAKIEEATGLSLNGGSL